MILCWGCLSYSKILQGCDSMNGRNSYVFKGNEIEKYEYIDTLSGNVSPVKCHRLKSPLIITPPSYSKYLGMKKKCIRKLFPPHFSAQQLAHSSIFATLLKALFGTFSIFLPLTVPSISTSSTVCLLPTTTIAILHTIQECISFPISATWRNF